MALTVAVSAPVMFSNWTLLDWVQLYEVTVVPLRGVAVAVTEIG